MSKNKNGNYSGKASISFEIERYKNIRTQTLMTEDEVYEVISNLDEFDHDYIIGHDYIYECIPLSINGDAYYDHGRTNCSNDDAYPPEGEININSVIGPDGKDWEDVLTESERDQIRDMIAEGAQEDGSDYDDYVDDYMDRRYEYDRYD